MAGRLIRRLLLAAVPAMLAASDSLGEQVKKAAERSEIDTRYKWRLEDIYPSDNAWEKDFRAVEEKIPELEAYHGKLADSAQNLFAVMCLQDSLGLALGKLYVYSNMRRDEDTGLDAYQSLADRASSLSTRYSAAASWVVPEILSISEEKLRQWLETTDGLALYRHRFDDILRTREHTLTPGEEKILALSGEVTRMPRTIFSMLDNADIRYPSITDENGEEVELTKARFSKILDSGGRELRQRAFEAFYQTYNKYENTLAALLSAIVKRDVFYARARNYNSSLEAALDADAIPAAVYDNVVASIGDNLAPLHRYVALRKKVLGLEKVHPYDIYTPLFQAASREYPYDDAVKLVLEALAPLGDTYLEAARQGFASHWIDVYETRGKRSGGYSWGSYDTHPYILLNYNGTLHEVFTVAHEMGHALHSHFTWGTQPPVYGDYTIFVAEVASTANENLLIDHLLDVSEDRLEKLSLLDHHVRQIQGTIYIQALFAEFEREIHRQAEQDQPLTASGLKKLTRELYQKYFGPELAVDEIYEINWGRIPHFYNNFYVYQYATGFSAATLLAEKILRNEPGARERYLQFLSSGSSDYSIDLLKKAGVDMAGPEPILAVARQFDRLLDQMEELIGQ
ncbi:MAG TPA: oligoendopeptidase F [Candidatus Glassbacteria bacterium]|nr:oligoendopeptidase F [Candidatus Glassbacteria bacterium]